MTHSNECECAFNFIFFPSLSSLPSGFLIFTGPTAHPRDRYRCTMGTLKLCNVYIIHTALRKVLIKLYVANGGSGSHRLNVLPISQMSQWIDRERGELVGGGLI